MFKGQNKNHFQALKQKVLMNTSSKLLSSLIFSETYAKIKDSFGSVDTSYYGDLEVVKFKIPNGHYQG